MKLFLPENMKDFPLIEGLETNYYIEGDTSIYEAEIIVGNVSEVFKHPEKFTKLKYLHLLSSGYDHVPLNKLSSMGVQVSNARGLYSVQIAEYCMAYTLFKTKEINNYEVSKTEINWNRDIFPQTLEQKKALILGTGSIGFELSNRLKAFGVHVTGVNSNGRQVDGFDVCVSLDDVGGVLYDMDYVYSALPSNQSTYHRINDSFLAKMKEGSILMNVGRGDVLDEEALEKHLDKLALVVLDVFAVEPLPKESYLWKHPKVSITPHISFRGDLNDFKAYKLVKGNIEAFLKKDDIGNLIN